MLLGMLLNFFLDFYFVICMIAVFCQNIIFNTNDYLRKTSQSFVTTVTTLSVLKALMF